MNRQTKRMMQKQGGDRPPERRAVAAPAPTRERVTIRQYIGEARDELRKVGWPTRREVVNSTLVVLIAVVIMTSLIFLFDYSSAKFVLFLFD